MNVEAGSLNSRRRSDRARDRSVHLRRVPAGQRTDAYTSHMKKIRHGADNLQTLTL